MNKPFGVRWLVAELTVNTFFIFSVLTVRSAMASVEVAFSALFPVVSTLVGVLDSARLAAGMQISSVVTWASPSSYVFNAWGSVVIGFSE